MKPLHNPGVAGPFFLKPDRSDRETGGNSSQITSTGDWRVDHMTEQSRCACVGGCALMCVKERAFYVVYNGVMDFLMFSG